MPENGAILRDGVEADHLDFDSGTEVQISVAERRGRPGGLIGKPATGCTMRPLARAEEP